MSIIWGGFDAQTLGFGAGLYVNYLLLIVWGCDCVRTWLAPTTLGVWSIRLVVIWQIFLAFIVFNATVVFAQSSLRWVAAIAFAYLATLCIGLRSRLS